MKNRLVSAFQQSIMALRACALAVLALASPWVAGQTPTSQELAALVAANAGATKAQAPTLTNLPIEGDRSLDKVEAAETTPAAKIAAASPKGAPVKSRVALPNEFQKFVLQITGTAYPLFGAGFFDATQNADPDANRFPVGDDYVLGPRDQLQIRVWGSINADLLTTLDRNGQISLPKLGTLSLAGVRASQATNVVKTYFARNYKDFDLSVTLGKLRSITVYVVGQSSAPGSYTLGSQATLTAALFVSGGPGANGSIRRVQLKRNGATIAEFDLYAFLAKGDKSADVKLQDGDVIYYPAALGYVALTGKVNSPAIYELKSDSETIADYLALAGGLPVVADPRKVTLERLQPGVDQPRRIEELALNPQGLKQTLKSGDVLTVPAIIPELSNAVTLRGSVSQPTRTPWRPGMRVSDLITRKSMLTSPESVRKQNEVLLTVEDRSLAGRIGNLVDEVNLEYAVVERVHREDLRVEVIPFSLGRVLADATDANNLQLQPGDVLTVFSATDITVPQGKRQVFVRIEGEVNRPGVYPVTAGDNLSSIFAKAGGTTPDAYVFGLGFYREDVKKSQQENLSKLLRRMQSEGDARIAQATQSLGASADAALAQAKVQSLRTALDQSIERVRTLKPEGRISLALPAEIDQNISGLPALRLQNGDKVVIPARPDFVYIFGAINTESALLYKPGKKVSDYLQQSGVGSAADLDNILLLRPDGSVLTNNNNFRNEVLGAVVLPGDSLVVPDKVDRETGWSSFIRNTKDITQILYQLGLGAAAIKTLRQ